MPSQILPIKRSAGFRDSRVDLVTLVDIQPCAQDNWNAAQSAVGWLMFPIPVTSTELDCSPNELPLFSHPTGFQPALWIRFLACHAKKVSIPTRKANLSLTCRHIIRVTMSKQHSPPARSLLMPTDIHKYGRMTADNLPQNSYQGDRRSPSDDGTETETMWVFAISLPNGPV